MTYGNLNVDTVTTSTAGGVLGAGNASLMKNRIINGACVIDQRNAGASFTPTTTNGYSLDRWNTYVTQNSKLTIQQNAGSVTPPVGFTKYLGVTSSSAYSVVAGDYFCLVQSIEGYNIADLAFGTANAKTITLSFQVYSSLTGTFGGALRNSAGNRSYPFTYTVSSANTWTTINVTIAGDTTGTWVTDNGTGLMVFFGLGAGSTYSGTAGSWSANNYLSATGATSVVGTNGATFYITGVQLEVGSSSTGYEYENYGQTLAKCQRYYYQLTVTSYRPLVIDTATAGFITMDFPIQQRTAPTGISTTGTFTYRTAGGTFSGASTVTFNSANISSAFLSATGASMTAGQIGLLTGTSATIGFTGVEL